MRGGPVMPERGSAAILHRDPCALLLPVPPLQQQVSYPEAAEDRRYCAIMAGYMHSLPGMIVPGPRMSAIIRLQGLPAIADSVDIRQFFYGLNIPKGGVYITGGKFGEAFILFATYEDARCALCLSGRPLKNSQIHLAPSNESEMQRALEIYRLGGNESMGALYYPGTNVRVPVGKPSYIYIHGMPLKTTKVDIRDFFKGLPVIDIIFLKFGNGIRNGNGIVKFANSTDATEGLKFSSRCICESSVTLKLSDEKEWIKNDGSSNVRGRELSPSRSSSYRRRLSRSRSRSPRNRRVRASSPYIREFYVHLINLSYRAEKRDIKKLFYDTDMSDSRITFLLDKDGRRTKEAFTMFTTQKDYKRALSLNNETFKGNTINILAISRRNMLELIERMKTRVAKDHPDFRKSTKQSSREKRCMFLRNFPAEITKADVKNFFTGYSLKEDNISLLFDSRGQGLGEVLVKFANETEAHKAERLNHKKFLGTEILLSRITEEQMKAFGNVTSISAAQNTDELNLVSQADDTPDVSSESVYKPPSSLAVEVASSLDSSGVMPALDSREEEMRFDVDDPIPFFISKTEDEAPDSLEAPNEASVEAVQTVPVLESESPLQQSDIADERPGESELLSSDVENGCNEESNLEAANNRVTLLFIRNLPCTVTVAEILDFFNGYKMSSVNLKNIERGIATVRMSSYKEAVSAINALNKKEIGHKQAFLSLF
ncbi:RNA-binding protein 12B-B-like [Pseudophryne corroboree]|uniref:RNA-binding protein 12B-B-like n=1 Tax=Pseudophryne corroboree TaxID=495146 RepID=UPI003081A399